MKDDWLEGGAEEGEKDLNVLLGVWAFLAVDQVGDDLILDLLWELHGPHDSLHKIHCLCEMRVLFVQCGHDRSHVTKDKGGDNWPNDDNERGDDGLNCGNRADLSSYDQQDGVVEDHGVLVEEVGGVEDRSIGLLVLGRHPGVPFDHDKEPRTGGPVHKDKEEEEKLEDLEGRLKVGFYFEIRDDSA